MYLFSSIWRQSYYYFFGFMMIVVTILVILSGEVSLAVCYFQLCKLDFNWWWRSFMTSGTSCIYLLIYGFVYSQLYLKLRGASVVVFMGYVVGMALVIAIITGCSGFLATFVFVKYIYNQIKSEYHFAF
jgi:transmembrane 9 superfamily protein 2/4